MRLYFIVIIVLCLLIPFVLAGNPPSLTEFQQLYGEVKDLPNGTFTLKAVVGSNEYTAPITDKKYGYSPTFKVRGRADDLILFSVVAFGIETPVGNTTYLNQEVTKLDLQYPVTEPSAGGTTDGTNTSSQQSTTSNVRARDRSTSTSTTQNEAPPPASCLHNWECSGWSACINGRQTTSCFRLDKCDDYERNGITSIIKTPKPAESRPCLEESTQSGSTYQPSAKICSPGMTRCFGQTVQSCSYDGTLWQTSESCAAGCDSVTTSCRQAPAPSPVVTQKPLPSWLYPAIGGVVILIAIIVLVVFLLHRKQEQFAPGREYVEEERAKGFPDAQIRTKLISQGWGASQVDKLMK